MENRKELAIQINGLRLEGILDLPKHAVGLVVFVHGSGSSRHSPRNQYVAKILNSRRLSTLLFDLLTKEEESLDERTRQIRFDIPLLAERLAGVTRWLDKEEEIGRFPLGYFGASTGAAAALVAAARLPRRVAAIVSRGGRPDLAAGALRAVKAPTLLLVGGCDFGVIELNQQALKALGCREKELRIISGATHLFEEAGALEQVADQAAEWFEHYLGAVHQSSQPVPRAS